MIDPSRGLIIGYTVPKNIISCKEPIYYDSDVIPIIREISTLQKYHCLGNEWVYKSINKYKIPEIPTGVAQRGSNAVLEFLTLYTCNEFHKFFFPRNTFTSGDFLGN